MWLKQRLAVAAELLCFEFSMGSSWKGKRQPELWGALEGSHYP